MISRLLLRLPPSVPRVSTPLSLLLRAMARNLSVRSPGITTLLRPPPLSAGLADRSKVGAELDDDEGTEVDDDEGTEVGLLFLLTTGTGAGL